MTSTNPGWLALAACKGVPLDFHDPDKRNVRACKAVCAECQGHKGCLEFALNMERSNDSMRWGVWGGKTPEERKVIEKKRARVRTRKTN